MKTILSALLLALIATSAVASTERNFFLNNQSPSYVAGIAKGQSTACMTSLRTRRAQSRQVANTCEPLLPLNRQLNIYVNLPKIDNATDFELHQLLGAARDISSATRAYYRAINNQQ